MVEIILQSLPSSVTTGPPDVPPLIRQSLWSHSDADPGLTSLTVADITPRSCVNTEAGSGTNGLSVWIASRTGGVASQNALNAVASLEKA
jgi:hypothetical protein